MTLTGGEPRDEFLGPTWSDDDVAALIRHLGLDRPDVGFSLRGAWRS
jgi:hypothetical protein